MSTLGALVTVLLSLDMRWTLFVVVTILVTFAVFRTPMWGPSGTGGWSGLPPGPRGWPILGYLPQIAAAKETPHELFSKLTKRYGNIISLNLAGQLVVVLHGFEAVKEGFAKQQLSARPMLNVYKALNPNSKGVLTSRGEASNEIRRFCSQVFRKFGVGTSRFEERTLAEVQLLVDEIKSRSGTPFRPKYVIGNAASNVISSIIFGRRFPYTDRAFRRVLEYTADTEERSGAGSFIERSPLISKLSFLPVVSRYRKTLQGFVAEIQRLISKARSAHQPPGEDGGNEVITPRHLVDFFLNETTCRENTVGAKNPGSVFKVENLAEVVKDLFSAGTETVTSTVRWGLLYFVAYPEVQDRVQKELDSVTNRERLPRMSDRPVLPYTDATIHEIQRYSTITPMAIPHYCSEETEVQGYVIPKDTVVVSNLWHGNFDPSVWADPQQFRPERFLDHNGIVTVPKYFTPYGTGHRRCIGERLAIVELFTFISLLLHHFTFVKPEDGYQISLLGVNGGSSAPGDFQVRAVPRQ